MILKDLRISPLRNILTGISMFVGIIAMISSVLVGTLGKEYLISVNAQMYGWSPTYSFSITGSDFQDTIKMENFFREIYNTDHFVGKFNTHIYHDPPPFTGCYLFHAGRDNSCSSSVCLFSTRHK